MTSRGAEAEALKERKRQGEGDTLLMKLCCVQLFNAARLDDVLAIWKAKTSSFDAACSIDIQLLCAAGLDATRAYLLSVGSTEATAALRRINECETGGDFEGFEVATYSAQWRTYYGM